MRVLIDTSVFISYLLTPHQDSFVQLIFDKILDDSLVLLIPKELLYEIETTVRRKPYLFNRIGESRLELFLSALQELAELIPPLNTPIPTITRDANDDYLIAYAIVGEASYLISGDKDLLVLKKIGDVQVVHPGEFRELL